MTGFWPTFLGGVAAGVVILLVGIFIRKLIHERSQSGIAFRLNTKQLGPVVVVVVGGAVVITTTLTRQADFDVIALLLVFFGFIAIIAGAELMRSRK